VLFTEDDDEAVLFEDDEDEGYLFAGQGTCVMFLI
jgi:hypothetical protein